MDGKRNVIQETRVKANGQTIMDVIMDWDQLNPPGVVEGWDYRGRYSVAVNLGKELYQLSDPDLADV